VTISGTGIFVINKGVSVSEKGSYSVIGSRIRLSIGEAFELFEKIGCRLSGSLGNRRLSENDDETSVAFLQEKRPVTSKTQKKV
jgi:hypothetical protein